MPYAGTMGWLDLQPLSGRLFGIPGPDPENKSKDAPLTVSATVRTAGSHKDYLSVRVRKADRGLMLLVFDDRNNLVGQVFGNTHEACTRKMNALFEAKGLGVYNSRYADGG